MPRSKSTRLIAERMTKAAGRSRGAAGAPVDRRMPPTGTPVRSLSAAAFGHLAAAVTHEVRSPLNSMAIHLELIEQRMQQARAGVPEMTARSLEVLRQEVTRIDAILEGFLRQVAPADAQPALVSVEELLAAAIDRAAARAGRRIEVAEATAGRWCIDREATELALDALIDNALDAAPANERSAVVRLRASERNGTAVIEVLDRGEGIAPEVLAKIFQLGFTTRPGRAGVGLTVARQAIKGQGGSLTIRSDGARRGAEARIELPLDLVDAPDGIGG